MKIQDKLKQMGEYACLALCYLEMVNIIDDRKPFFILMGMKEGFLDDECTVKNPEGFLELVSGKKYKVTKMNTFDKDKAVIARFVRKGYNHFAIINGKTKRVIYNTLEHSKCVELGTIESYRIIEEIDE